MLVGTFIQAIMFILFALSPSPWLDYAAFIGVSIGGAIYRPAKFCTVGYISPETLRDVFATFTTANNIGAILGPPLGAIFFFYFRQELLWVCAILLLLYFLAIYLIVQETFLSSAQMKKTLTITHEFKDQLKRYRKIFSDKVMVLYIATAILRSSLSCSWIFICLSMYKRCSRTNPIFLERCFVNAFQHRYFWLVIGV